MTNASENGYTVQEAAQILRKSPATIYRWIEAGKLRAESETFAAGQRLRVFIDQPLEGEMVDDSHENAMSNTVTIPTESDALNLSAALRIIENQRETLDEKERIIENLLSEKAVMAGQLGTFAARLDALTPKQLPAPARPPWWQFWKH